MISNSAASGRSDRYLGELKLPAFIDVSYLMTYTHFRKGWSSQKPLLRIIVKNKILYLSDLTDLRIVKNPINSTKIMIHPIEIYESTEVCSKRTCYF